MEVRLSLVESESELESQILPAERFNSHHVVPSGNPSRPRNEMKTAISIANSRKVLFFLHNSVPRVGPPRRTTVRLYEASVSITASYFITRGTTVVVKSDRSLHEPHFKRDVGLV